VASRNFDQPTQNQLSRKFVAAWKKANPNIPNGDSIACDYAEVFVFGLGTYAHPEYFSKKNRVHESSQRRREKLRVFVNALDALAKAASRLDHSDLDAAIDAGLSMARPIGPDVPDYHRDIARLASDRSLIDVQELIYRTLQPLFGGREHEALGRFIKGASEFANCGKLPSFRDTPIADLAYGIVCFLEGQNINASTTSTGLAGLAFESTFQLAGLPPAKTSYWLRLAKDEWKIAKAEQVARWALLPPKEREREEWLKTPEGQAANHAALIKKLHDLTTQKLKAEIVLSWGY
jgi:hypothetical protein